jgi:hypothetical protein
MDMPGPDPEAMRWTQQLQAALIIAATTGASTAPAIDLAEEMIRRGVVITSSRGVVLAMQLVELSIQHEQDHPGTPDPYRALAARMRDARTLTDLDLDIATQSRVLNHGLHTGWLPAANYDRLAAMGGDDPQFLALLARIERRTTPLDADPEDRHG